MGGWTERPSTSWKVSDERPWVFVINGRRTNKDSPPHEQIRAICPWRSVRGGLVKSEVSYGAVKVSLDV